MRLESGQEGRGVPAEGLRAVDGWVRLPQDPWSRPLGPRRGVNTGSRPCIAPSPAAQRTRPTASPQSAMGVQGTRTAPHAGSGHSVDISFCLSWLPQGRRHTGSWYLASFCPPFFAGSGSQGVTSRAPTVSAQGSRLSSPGGWDQHPLLFPLTPRWRATPLQRPLRCCPDRLSAVLTLKVTGAWSAVEQGRARLPRETGVHGRATQEPVPSSPLPPFCSQTH